MKPLQAAVCLAAIGDVRLSDREIAVMCSSHNAEPIHLGAVRCTAEARGPGPVGAADAAGVAARRAGDGAGAASQPAVPRLLRQARRHVAGVRPCGLGHDDVPAALPSVAAQDPPRGPAGDRRRRRGDRRRRLRRAGPRRAARRHGDPVRAVRRDRAAGPARPSRPTSRSRACWPSRTWWAGATATTRPSCRRPGMSWRRRGPRRSTARPCCRRASGVAVKVADGSYRAAGPALIHALEQMGGLEPPHVSALAERARPPVLGGGRRGRGPRAGVHPAAQVNRRSGRTIDT